MKKWIIRIGVILGCLVLIGIGKLPRDQRTFVQFNQGHGVGYKLLVARRRLVHG